jgi:hypothetical protein
MVWFSEPGPADVATAPIAAPVYTAFPNTGLFLPADLEIFHPHFECLRKQSIYGQSSILTLSAPRKSPSLIGRAMALPLNLYHRL